MPLVEIKAFERRFADVDANQRLIATITDAVCDAFGEEVREETWVILDGVAPANWGFGGKARV